MFRAGHFGGGEHHTGIEMETAQDLAPREEPHGALSNRPIQVPDDLDAILKAIDA